MIAIPPVSSSKPIKLDAGTAAHRREELAEILVDAVAGGSSVNFLWPFELPEARNYWDRVIARIGAGELLLLAVEAEAQRRERTLLILDTETGSAADRLYRRLGYQVLGVMPHHARLPDGQLADTTFFSKHLTDGVR
jgi:hypothetical protein